MTCTCRLDQLPFATFRVLQPCLNSDFGFLSLIDEHLTGGSMFLVD
jgi:hypothetical protein